MKVLVSGSTGLVGEALIKELHARGPSVVRLARDHRRHTEPCVQWNPAEGELSAAELEGIEAVVHLAGESIIGCWKGDKKQKIEESRVKGTKLLAETLAKMDTPPKVLVSASAIGYYGDRGNETLTEVSGHGHPTMPETPKCSPLDASLFWGSYAAFLPRVCAEWEGACQPARDANIRVVNIRTGVVLSMKGGALKMMYLPFQLGVAGDLSFGGKQYFSWITLEDEVGAIIHCLENESLRGPVNLTAPNPVTNHEFTMALRRRLLPWPISEVNIPLPGWKIKLLTGDLGKEVFLASAKVKPVRLQETGYKFKHATLKEALKAVI